MKAASPGAVYIRDDGIVIIDTEKAAGQKAIVSACPIGAVYWNEGLNLPQKCTMCAELLDEGFAQPRCVGACPNGALYFGDLDDPNCEASKKIASGRVTDLPELEGKSANVVHLNIPALFLAGSVYTADDEPVEGAVVKLTDKKSGVVRTTGTNCFGDWEFEWLDKGSEYELVVEMAGFKTYSASVAADTDRYLGETILKEEACK